MAITVTCPTASGNVVVRNQMICVKGTATSFVLPLPKAQLVQPTTAHHHVRVKVVTRGDPAPNPTAGGTDTLANPTWCAKDVPIPAATGNMTAYAWEELIGSSGSTWGAAQTVDFVAGGSGAMDCCSGCVTSASMGELAATPPLEVTVPDGPAAGTYQAKPTGPMAWAVTVAGDRFDLFCDAEAKFVVHCREEATPSACLETGPFSATFPGSAFGAAGEVVVTLA